MSKKAVNQLKSLEKHPSVREMRLAAEGWENDFQTLVAIMMSARTRDETTIKVAKVLFKKYPTSEKMSKANLKSIEEIIIPINFYKGKARRILECSKIISKEYKNKIPNEIEKLIKLPGVGRKTANVFLAEKGNNSIGVDTHLAYISNYLGWSYNKNPKKIEKDLEDLFPKNYWRKLNSITVRFGKSNTSKRIKDRFLDKIK